MDLGSVRNDFTKTGVTKIDNIANGFSQHWSSKAKQRQMSKVELSFYQGKAAFDKAIKSINGDYINAVIYALRHRIEEIDFHISLTGGGNEQDLKEKAECVERLKQLKAHVEEINNDESVQQ
ncbi:hypothetical protein [Clostridium perfringens]|uniref:hypothetical protein n=1 Tax=Clostridium perfringens TaxID=1502 RepID=UPI0018E449A4|nr:hypothetical protein [Clostridium perfringens]MBI6042182.1 hypothetical protein [Clostridium perfringens]